MLGMHSWICENWGAWVWNQSLPSTFPFKAGVDLLERILLRLWRPECFELWTNDMYGPISIRLVLDERWAYFDWKYFGGMSFSCQNT